MTGALLRISDAKKDNHNWQVFSDCTFGFCSDFNHKFVNLPNPPFSWCSSLFYRSANVYGLMVVINNCMNLRDSKALLIGYVCV